MGRTQTFIRLTHKQREELKSFLREVAIHKVPDWHRVRRRAQAIWFSSPDYVTSGQSVPSGQTVKELSRHLGVAERSVWRWLAAFRAHGIKGLMSSITQEKKPK
jgi:hypothetical protein